MASRMLVQSGLRGLQQQARLAPVTAAPARWLNLHEYQSKDIMAKNHVHVQKFRVADTPAQAEQAARDLHVPEVVLKAQIHAGGRGKGVFNSGLEGGVKLSKDPKEIGKLASKMLGYKLKTKQTTGDGVVVNKVMVAEALDIARETYLAILMDRQYSGPVIVASPAGGMDIEDVAHKTPHLIFKEPIDITKGVSDQQAEKIAKQLQFKDGKIKEAAAQIQNLYKLFLKVDATQIEINPFGETPDGRVVCFDAKFNFDDNAAFRQKDIFAMRDTAEEDPREVEASKHNLNYIGMDGNIACLVNGAGLAMATMDIIQLKGGKPANFLDCGGGANEEMVTQAFQLLSKDPRVEAILVNIFGGIVNCATIANGVVAACRQTKLTLPLVVRLEGTNVENAVKILEQSGLPIISASNLEDAAAKAVAAAKKSKGKK